MKSIYSTAILLVISIQLQAQVIKSVTLKAGPTFSGQTIANSTVANSSDINGHLLGFSASIEPTFISFGNKKQFDFNTDFSFIQKGVSYISPVYTYDNQGQLLGTGSESYPVRINYISVSPSIKFNFANIVFVKVGPRADVFTGFHSAAKYSTDNRTSKDFNPVTFGITYGAGICAGKKRTKFICEVLGQQDFTQSSSNKTGQLYKNYAFLLNFGVNITLGK